MNWLIFGVIFFVVGAAGVFVLWVMRRPTAANDPANWPATEGKIHSVRRLRVSAGRSSYDVDVGDFSYTAEGDYNGGTLRISRSFSTHDAQPKDLINQKIEVRFNPKKPEVYSVPPQEIGGFLLDPYDETSGEEIGFQDIGFTDLKINDD